MAKGKRRPTEERALAVAMAEVCESGSDAAKLLNWPVNTVNLYRRQASEDPEFAKLCLAKRAELGAKFYDLAGGAAHRLMEKLNRDEIEPRTLVTLMGVSFQRGDTALNLEQPKVIEHHISADVAAERLRARIEQLEAATGGGPVLEAVYKVEE